MVLLLEQRCSSSWGGGGGGGEGGVSVSLGLPPGSPLSPGLGIFSSPVFSSILDKQRQLLRFATVSSQISVLMSRALMWRLQTYLYLSWGDLAVFCPKQADDRRYPWGSNRLPYGAHGQASAVYVVWAACTLWGGWHGQEPEHWALCPSSWCQACGKDIACGNGSPSALAWHRLSRFHFLTGGCWLCVRYTLLS